MSQKIEQIEKVQDIDKRDGQLRISLQHEKMWDNVCMRYDVDDVVEKLKKQLEEEYNGIQYVNQPTRQIRNEYNTNKILVMLDG